MKIGSLFALAGLILLISCQPKAEQPDALINKSYNRTEAAALNTQLGLAYLKQGNRPRAKRKLLAALSQAPDAPNVNAALAYFMENTGDYDEAKRYYQKAMNLAPGRGAQLNNYGAFLCRLGQYKEAEDYFLKAVKDIKYENTAGAYENAGLCALEVPDEQKAAQYFKKALEQDPARKQSLFELMTIELKHNNYEEALACLQKYSKPSLHNSAILNLAVFAAQNAGNKKLETNYKMRLLQLSNSSENTGAKYEYNNDNG